MRNAICGSLILVTTLAMTLPAQVGRKKEHAPKPPVKVEENWRVWGGPQRDFLSPSTGIFAPTEKWMSSPPKKLWERALGDGYSAIAVEDRVLYTGYRSGSNDVVIALDSNTGKTIWEFSYPAPFKNAFPEKAGPGPYAMPQVIGDRVVAASGIGQIHSLNKATGASMWSLDLYKDFGGNRLDFGYSSHALPYKDTLILVAGGKTHGVMRVRQSDGSVVWSKHQLLNAHSSPLLISVDGQPQVAIVLGQEIVGIDPETGDLLWRHPHPTQNALAISTPVWADGNLLFVSTAYSGGARALKLSRAGNKTEIRELWYNPRVQSHFGTVIRQGGFVYLSSGQNIGLITAVELETGRVAWQVRDFVKAQLLYADGRLVILDEDGTLGVGMASPERFQALAKWPLLSAISWSPPTLVHNRLYLRDRKVIKALEFAIPHK